MRAILLRNATDQEIVAELRRRQPEGHKVSVHPWATDGPYGVRVSSDLCSEEMQYGETIAEAASKLKIHRKMRVKEIAELEAKLKQLREEAAR